MMNRPLSQTLITRVAIGLTAVFALASGGFLAAMLDAEHKLVALENQRIEAGEAIHTLENTSDFLANYTQHFVGSADVKYSDAYWNEINVDKNREAADAAFKSTNPSAAENALLNEAVQMSNELVETETYAMRLVFESLEGAAAMPGPIAQFTMPAADAGLSPEDKRAKAIDLIYGSGYEDGKKAIQAKTKDLLAVTSERTHDAVKAQDGRVAMFSGWLIASLIGLSVVAIASLIMMSRMVGGVIRRYTQELKNRDPKNLDFELKPAGAREVHNLAHAFNAQTAQMNELLVDLTESAENLTSASAGMLDVATTMSSDTDTARSESKTAASSADSVRESVEAVSAATTEMGASIDEIAQEASRASVVAQSAVTAAESTTTTMTRLADSSKLIGDVVQTITALASQTNLLALNATIESARAGEAGKGFAVVAAEVKELARQTGEATEDIINRVQSIQDDTQAATSALSEITEVIEAINNGQSTIASAVEQQSATTRDISRSINEAAGGVTDIAQGVTSVSDSTENAAAGAHRTLEAAQELELMAEHFKEVAGSFRTRQ